MYHRKGMGTLILCGLWGLCPALPAHCHPNT